MSLEVYHNDNIIGIDYDYENNKELFPVNAVGPHGGIELEVKDYTDTDDNTIYVSDTTGNDTTGNGNKAAPYKTMVKAIDETTSLKTKVIALDSAIYAEDISGCTFSFLEGIFADTAQAPKLSLRTLDYTPSDSNSIFVSAETGDDSTGAGTQANPYATITHAKDQCDGTHQKVVILDSETYYEASFEFTGNYQGLYAALGESPVLKIVATDEFSTISTVEISPTVFESGDTEDIACAVLSNSDWVVCFRDDDDLDKGKFRIYEEDGTLVKDTTLFQDNEVPYTEGYPIGISAAALKNGLWVVAWNTSYGCYFSIFDETGTVQSEQVEIDGNASTGVPDVKMLPDGNFVIVYYRSGTGYFGIYDDEGNEVKAVTAFTPSGSVLYPRVDVFESGNWVCAYRDGSYGKFVIYSSAGEKIVEPTSFDSSTPLYVDVAVLDDQSFAVVFVEPVGDDGYFGIYDDSGNEISAPAVWSGTDNISYTHVLALKGNNFAVFYKNDTDSGEGQYDIIHKSGISQVSGETFETGPIGGASADRPIWADKFADGYIVICYQDSGDSSKGKYTVIFPYSATGIKVSVNPVINGVSIEADDQAYMLKLIKMETGTEIDIEFCSLLECCNPLESDDKGYALYDADGDDVTLLNSIIADNDAGVYAVTNDAVIKNNLFYRNGKEYAVKIDGAGSGIDIQHNTVYANRGGIYLDNNNGSEVVKNNIIHDNDLYGIYAETTLDISYSIITDEYNIGIGSSVVKASPLFVNEGLLIPADIDLNLKRTVLGYYNDSPACLLADTGIDAGAYDVRAIGSVPSWTSVTIAKPTKIISWIEPAGPAKNTRKSGSVSYKREAMTKFYRLTWNGVTLSDYEKILAVITAGGEVRFYPDPVTHPEDFLVCDVDVTANLADQVKVYTLSDIGRETVEMILSREYE